ncbi:MAG: hypothetical protein V1492_02640 [Candidatus Micrarchaeota archaeon]
MRKIFLVFALVLLVLAAGCTQPAKQDGSTGGTTAGSGTTGQPAGGETGGQPAGNESGGNTGETGNAMPSNLGQALTSLVPIECTATSTVEGKTQTVHMWVKGGNMRSEVDTPQGKMISVLKGQKVYTQIPNTTPGLNCDWMIFEINESAETGTGDTSSTDLLAKKDQTVVQCNPAVFGDEKFATPGTTCSLNDLMNQYQNPALPN